MADGAACEHEIDRERVSERRVVVPQTEGRERQEERGGDEQAEQERAAVLEQKRARAEEKRSGARGQCGHGGGFGSRVAMGIGHEFFNGRQWADDH